MKLLPEQIGLVGKKNFSTFNLPQIEQHFWHLFDRPAELIAVGVLSQEVPESLGLANDTIQQRVLPQVGTVSQRPHPAKLASLPAWVEQHHGEF